MIRLVCILSFLWSFSVHAQEYQTANGKATFLSKASLSEFTGESKTLKGLIDLDKNLVDFFLDLNTLKTGITLRDKHMRENYLETEKYPFAEFTGKFETLPKLNGASEKVTVRGKFKIHGVEREITVTGNLKKLTNGSLELKAAWVVALNDYKIDIPKLVFYELAAEQQVSIEAILNPKK
ncbi:YceI family protein [Algoriphagus aquatilis]|uniref:YceI family protein n=1 Tax=Algoriphagus aquatilis TaxID=490186 RepID=A0ABW0BTM6_9BACT|nr:YceI family protein [Algoriphagus sp.]